MSLFPIETIQNCSKCGESFIYTSNIMDIPLDVRCSDCNNPYFKRYKPREFFNIENRTELVTETTPVKDGFILSHKTNNNER